MKLVLVFCSLLVSVVISDTTLYLINIESGKALTYDGNALTFADKKFGDSTQQWKFSDNGTLLVLFNDEYLGYNSQSNMLEMRQTDNIAWSWENMQIVLQNPQIKLCITQSGDQAVSCDQKSAAAIILHLYEEEVESTVKDLNYLFNVTSDDISSNITSLNTMMRQVNAALKATDHDLIAWNTTLSQAMDQFSISSQNMSDTINIAKGRLDDELTALQVSMTKLWGTLSNVSTHLNDTHFDFTALRLSLSNFSGTTETALTKRISSLSDILSEKSTNGHMTPDNLYEFAAIFLLALGMINIADIGRRLIKYSVQSSGTTLKYGTD